MQTVTLLQLIVELAPLAAVAAGWLAYGLLGRRWLRGAWSMRLFP